QSTSDGFIEMDCWFPAPVLVGTGIGGKSRLLQCGYGSMPIDLFPTTSCKGVERRPGTPGTTKCALTGQRAIWGDNAPGSGARLWVAAGALPCFTRATYTAAAIATALCMKASAKSHTTAWLGGQTGFAPSWIGHEAYSMTFPYGASQKACTGKHFNASLQNTIC